MRERLIELLNTRQDRGRKWSCFENGQSVEDVSNETLADYLLANGVIVAPMPMADWLRDELAKHVYERCMEEL